MTSRTALPELKDDQYLVSDQRRDKADVYPNNAYGILVGVDGSPPSKVAVDWAAREASMRNLPLTIIYVAPSAMAPGGVPIPASLAERVEKHGHAVLRDARNTAEEAIEGAEPIRIDTEIVSAAVLPTLIGRSKDADMVVVGCRGLGAIGGGCLVLSVRGSFTMPTVRSRLSTMRIR